LRARGLEEVAQVVPVELGLGGHAVMVRPLRQPEGVRSCTALGVLGDWSGAGSGPILAARGGV
jgi:hypothetical protein